VARELVRGSVAARNKFWTLNVQNAFAHIPRFVEAMVADRSEGIAESLEEIHVADRVC